MRIHATLNKDRLLRGTARVLDDSSVVVLGPWFVLGKADSEAASLHGNPSRDPRKPWGDTPTGTYKIVRLVVHPNTEQSIWSYGPSKSILIAGVSGDAAVRDPEKNLDGIEMHGGTARIVAGNRVLRPTHGCIRSFDEDQAALIALVESTGIAKFDILVDEA